MADDKAVRAPPAASSSSAAAVQVRGPNTVLEDAAEDLRRHFGADKSIPAGVGDDTLDPEEMIINRRVNRKMDLAMLPMLSLLYLFNGLDKGNVGNAETQGFTTDIGAHPSDLNLAVSLFFITFVLFQPPSAALGRWFGPKNWIPFMTFSWGVVTIGQAFIKGRGALIAIRLLIGLFEAGFYPTCVSYLSFFYRRFDLAIRIAIFYGQYAIAGAFAGAISYGIFHIKNGSLYNWQYLFIIEGTLTCIVAAASWFVLPAGPGSAWFLTGEERRFATARMQKDTALFTQHEYGEDGLEKDRLSKRDAVETAKDWKLWYVLVFNICASVPTQAFSVFLPLVLKGLGFSSIEANLVGQEVWQPQESTVDGRQMTVPPYVCGAIGLYLFAYSSDHRMERGYHIIVSLAIGIVGLILTVTVSSAKAKYAGLCVLLFGCYVSAPLTVAWLSGNTPEPGKRTLVLGVNGFGNLAGVIGSQVYDAKYGPSYRTSFFITLGIAIFSFIGYVSYRFTLAAVNRSKRKRLSEMTPQAIENERTDNSRYADKKITFIYRL